VGKTAHAQAFAMTGVGKARAAELAVARSSSFVAANFNRDCRLALPVKASLLR